MDKEIYRKIVIIQFIAFGSYAPMNYYNVLLKNIGFDSARIGLLGSVSSIIAALTLPLWGVLSDKTASAKKLFLLSLIIYAAIFAALPAAGNMAAYTFMPIYTLIVLYSLVRQPTHSLQDAWILGMSGRYGFNFTATRKWGSFGFAVVSVLLGFIAVRAGTGLTFYFAPALIIPLLVFCRDFPPREETSLEPRAAPAAQVDAVNAASPGALTPVEPNTVKIRPWTLFKNYRLMTAFIMTVALSFYVALVSPFYPFILESAGLDANLYGVISGYGAFVQVVCMWFVSTRCRKTPLHVILIAGALVGVGEQVMYGLASGFIMMMAAGTLWGISMAIYVSTLPTYIHSLVPHTHTATALSLNGALVMLVTIVGNYSGGRLISGIGIDAYNYALAALRGALTLLFILSLLVGKKINRLSDKASAP